MADYNLKKTVYSKDQFEKAIDTTFKTFKDPEILGEDDTVENLFRLYSLLYYEIPAHGDENSHEYLVNESRKQLRYDSETDAIQPLLDEITDLRERLLAAQEALLETTIEQAENAGN